MMSPGTSEGSRKAASERDVGVVIVTHRRPQYLKLLLQSLAESIPCVGRVVVVDNGGDADTLGVVSEFTEGVFQGRLDHIVTLANVGGSGGFAVGMEAAFAAGVPWIWVMDDDVVVAQGGLGSLLPWTDRYMCIHGGRVDADGQGFHFQPFFEPHLGIALPKLGNVFENGFFETNIACFEGMLIHRHVVELVGLPDPRFFLTWDDAIYGWEVSRHYPVVVVESVALQRVRPLRHRSLGIRPLLEASDLSRYFVMRNRALVRRYLQDRGMLSPVAFAVGTFLTFAKELVRLGYVERRLAGIGHLLRGWVAAWQFGGELHRDGSRHFVTVKASGRDIQTRTIDAATMLTRAHQSPR